MAVAQTTVRLTPVRLDKARAKIHSRRRMQSGLCKYLDRVQVLPAVNETVGLPPHYHFARMITTNTGRRHGLIESKIAEHIERRNDPDQKRILSGARRVVQTDQG